MLLTVLSYVAIILLLSIATWLFIRLTITRNEQQNVTNLNNILSLENNNLKEELKLLYNDNKEFDKLSGEYKLKFENSQTILIKNEAIINDLNQQIILLQKTSNSLQLDLQKARQETQFMTQQIDEWNILKEKHLEASKASILEAGANLSNKLLEDHKREAKLAKEENEKQITQTTETIYKSFNHISETIAGLNKKVGDSEKTVDIVRRALLSPSGAGNLSEITLENIFKFSSLVEDIDYKTQFHVQNDQGQIKRPDAVVFLPDNNIMVIDSKASKFFLAIEEESSELEELQMTESLKKSMYSHLKSLESKDYKAAIAESIKNNMDFSDANITVFMFLPSESAVEKIRKIDNNFFFQACSKQIIPIGPAGLVNALTYAKLFITQKKQVQNSKIIINEVGNLINSISQLQNWAQKLGKSIKNSVEQYDSFSASFNRTFLSKAVRLRKLGIDANNKSLEKLPRYQIIAAKTIIDGDIEEEMDKKLELTSD